MGEFFSAIQSSSASNITTSPFSIIMNLGMALILGLVYSYIYSVTYGVGKLSRQLQHEMRSMQYTILLLTVGGALIWIVVADNLVRAFGLAGALSLIRFRTVLREPMNTIKVFYAIILGMACGLGQFLVAIIGTLFICLILALIHIIRKKEKSNKKKKHHKKIYSEHEFKV